MRTRAQLLLLCAGFALLAAGLAAFGVRTLIEFQAATQQAEQHRMQAFYGERLNRLVATAVMESRGIYAAHDLDEAQRFADRLDGVLTEVQGLLQSWHSLVGDGEATPERTDLAGIAAAAQDFTVFRQEIVALGRVGHVSEADRLGNNDANRANRQALQDQIDAVVQRRTEEVDRLRTETEQLARRSLLTTLAVAVLFLAGTLSFVYWLAGRQRLCPICHMAVGAHWREEADRWGAKRA